MFEVSIEPELERAALLKSEEQQLVSWLEVQGRLSFLLNKPLQQYS